MITGIRRVDDGHHHTPDYERSGWIGPDGRITIAQRGICRMFGDLQFEWSSKCKNEY